MLTQCADCGSGRCSGAKVTAIASQTPSLQDAPLLSFHLKNWASAEHSEGKGGSKIADFWESA
ncbi:hypothetical protein [Geitlerinema sp. PCC 7407]|uniref:hypothetical protein n=1 Tax=Geitlerinema sp. PCC 7407 TaxID=1173025 RepID=UPI0002E5656F|nr:hypothetical protein [Geitlerinema sp. PCC 7407]